MKESDKFARKSKTFGLANDTILWFISDNGGTGSNKTTSPLTRAGKSSMYEGEHRVPGIVWAPGRVTPGKCSELIMGMDIMPTSLAMAKIEPPKDHQFDGVDAGPALFESKQLAERTVIWGRDANGAIRRGPWKLVKDELYNLDKDPQETAT